MRDKMRGTVLASVLCAMIMAGCLNRGPVAIDQNIGAAADIRKAELLRELDKKWENPDAHYQLGQIYQNEGDWSKAEWHYNIAIGFNPAQRDAQAALVKLQFDKGDRAKGEWAANNYMTQAASSPEQTLALGAAFEKQGLDNYAIKCYQDALKLAPNSPAVNRQLGYYYLAKNDKEQAKNYFIRSFQLNSNQPDVANELGKLGVVVRIPQAPSSPESLSKPVRPSTQP
jgi:Flp pilus assembly protein TadD